MVFALGKTAWYLYGASSNEKRNLMATYGVQWTAIQWAKARGCTQYDLWGIPELRRLEQSKPNSKPARMVYGACTASNAAGAASPSLGAWQKPQPDHLCGVSMGCQPPRTRDHLIYGEVVTDLTIDIITDRAVWNDVLRQLPYAHVLQTWEWGDFKHVTTGWRPIRLMYKRDDQIVAMASVGLRRIGPLNMPHVSKGPRSSGCRSRFRRARSLAARSPAQPRCLAENYL